MRVRNSLAPPGPLRGLFSVVKSQFQRRLFWLSEGLVSGLWPCGAAPRISLARAFFSEAPDFGPRVRSLCRVQIQRFVMRSDRLKLEWHSLEQSLDLQARPPIAGSVGHFPPLESCYISALPGHPLSEPLGRSTAYKISSAAS
jgi:hypothetical protein